YETCSDVGVAIGAWLSPDDSAHLRKKKKPGDIHCHNQQERYGKRLLPLRLQLQGYFHLCVSTSTNRIQLNLGMLPDNKYPGGHPSSQGTQESLTDSRHPYHGMRHWARTFKAQGSQIRQS